MSSDTVLEKEDWSRALKLRARAKDLQARSRSLNNSALDFESGLETAFLPILLESLASRSTPLKY